ncbi:MAG: hypothetical protein VX529_11995 [Pseudomonadota bacterium]|jgi:hypothetical protein|nr:hypothetical protein [Pseudomonadota bacterium]
MTASVPGPVVITLDSATQAALTNGGYALYASCAVKIDNTAALPTIWHVERVLTETITLALATDVQAYTSTTAIASGKTISVGNSTAIDLGQTWQVASGGSGPVKQAGPADKMTVENTSKTPFTAGLSRCVDGDTDFTPVFAAPLYGLQSNGAAPVSQIVLQFSTARQSAGSVMSLSTARMQAHAQISAGQYLSVQLADGAARQVSFDINTGWSWGDYTWGQVLTGQAAVLNALIQPE